VDATLPPAPIAIVMGFGWATRPGNRVVPVNVSVVRVTVADVVVAVFVAGAGAGEQECRDERDEPRYEWMTVPYRSGSTRFPTFRNSTQNVPAPSLCPRSEPLQPATPSDR